MHTVSILTTQLEIFIKAFRNLRRGNTKHGPAPHKPILLLSFIELFDKGLILENRVYVNADLVGTFRENWELLVHQLEGKAIGLPGNFNHYPSKEHLSWHREHIFKAR